MRRPLSLLIFAGLGGSGGAEAGRTKLEDPVIPDIVFPNSEILPCFKVKVGTVFTPLSLSFFYFFASLNVPVSCETPLMREQLLRKLW